MNSYYNANSTYPLSSTTESSLFVGIYINPRIRRVADRQTYLWCSCYGKWIRHEGRSVWVQTRLCVRRQGWVERCGGGVGGWVCGCCGMERGVEATGSAGQVRWEILSFSSVCKACAGIQRNHLNIKRRLPAVFSLFLFNNRGWALKLWYFCVWESDGCITVLHVCINAKR